MTKNAFIAALGVKLAGLPQDDVLRSLEYYAGYIDDAVEDGMSEDEAVGSLGSVDDVAVAILADVPMVKLAKSRLKRECRFRAWEIVLLSLGAPLWISLLAAAFSVVVAVYASLWSVVISLFAATLGLAAGALGGILVSICAFFTGQGAGGLFLLGCAAAAAGLAILFFYVSFYTAKGAVWLGEKFWLVLKKMIMKKEKQV